MSNTLHRVARDTIPRAHRRTGPERCVDAQPRRCRAASIARQADGIGCLNFAGGRWSQYRRPCRPSSLRSVVDELLEPGRGRSASTADWTASWSRSIVNDEEWVALRQKLGAEARAWLETLSAPRDYTEARLNDVIASVAHLAYHLGAIRQIPTARSTALSLNEGSAPAVLCHHVAAARGSFAGYTRCLTFTRTGALSAETRRNGCHITMVSRSARQRRTHPAHPGCRAASKRVGRSVQSRSGNDGCDGHCAIQS